MSLRFKSLAALALLQSALVLSANAQQPAPPSKFEDDIRRFERQDREHPPEPGQILFLGSSSIRMWKSLPRDFDGLPLIQRGFGGSTIRDCITYAPRIVLPYKPRLVVLYAGDNDIARGLTPEQVLQDFREFSDLVHQQLPQTRIAFIAIKPSIARWKLRAEITRANQLVQNFTKTSSALDFIDIYQPMLNQDDMPSPELFLDDGLHLNATGYRLWTSVIRPHLD